MPANLFANLSAISYALPENVLDNSQLSKRFPEWDAQKIANKTGILQRRISKSEETALDLGVAAAQKLLTRHPEIRDRIDALLFCTESPDYCLPPNACLAQNILKLGKNILATDFSLGCSGFVYGLSIANGLILSHQASCVLLITAETYTKYLAENDKSVRTLFGDAGAATIINASIKPGLTDFVFATDGSGGQNLIVPFSGARRDGEVFNNRLKYNIHVSKSSTLFMHGPKLFQFCLDCVPDLLHRCLAKAGKEIKDIDCFVLHQANLFMLEQLRIKCGISKEKFIVNFSDIGNTVSCTIPIALKRSIDDGIICQGQTIFIAGFGVGYSACAALLTVNDKIE